MNDKEKILCPCCGCDDENIRLVSTNTKIFTAAGGGAGAVIGYFAKKASVKAGIILGARIGSVIPGLGTVTGAAAGAILTGFCAGAVAGNFLGTTFDAIANTYRCNKCSELFEI